jgi:hypothetical protein
MKESAKVCVIRTAKELPVKEQAETNRSKRIEKRIDQSAKDNVAFA